MRVPVVAAGSQFVAPEANTTVLPSPAISVSSDVPFGSTAACAGVRRPNRNWARASGTARDDSSVASSTEGRIDLSGTILPSVYAERRQELSRQEISDRP